tara:strand:+ start:2493 stop:2714 length:222 start_codon:yes stop_codon:yes gene_type:complete
MKLSQYLVVNGISQKQFAADLGVCQATIHKYLYEKSCPSGKRMMQIYQITDYQVGLMDWLEHFEDEDGQSLAG